MPKQLRRNKSMMAKVVEARSPTLNILGILMLLLLGAVAIPALVGLIATIPDLVRYLRIRSM